MTEEQKERLRLTQGALSVLRVQRDGLFEKDPNNEWAKFLDSAIAHIEVMIKEWAFAIGHPVKISDETIEEIVDKATPIIAETIKRRIAEENL